MAIEQSELETFFPNAPIRINQTLKALYFWFKILFLNIFLRSEFPENDTS